ncbi:MAG: hypothetical protein V1729_01825 [Candidatus Woesearchaeota archaeon]
MSKKAQGMSMNVIIIAAIALLVLVILVVIFIGRMNTTTQGIDKCKGSCTDEMNDCKETYGTYYTEASGTCADGQHCCVGVGG